MKLLKSTGDFTHKEQFLISEHNHVHFHDFSLILLIVPYCPSYKPLRHVNFPDCSELFQTRKYKHSEVQYLQKSQRHIKDDVQTLWRQRKQIIIHRIISLNIKLPGTTYKGALL